ncbi:MAG: hypothetical protein K0M45_00085 [Candidatus Paracaedibacteraceae bacterium]|nr:hypothetical protein [Candidatus Paracaedibacteraceae bacterium]
MTVLPCLSSRSPFKTSRSRKNRSAWLASLLLLQVFHLDPLRAMEDPKTTSPHVSKKQLDELREGMVESLSNASLASVSPLLDNHPPLKEDHAERQALFEKIIEVTQAEYDWPYHVKKSLEEFIPTCQDSELQQKLQSLVSSIKEPENLIVLRPGEDRSRLHDKHLSPQHRVFGSFRKILEQIDNFLPTLKDHPTLAKDLLDLRTFYNKFITAVCAGASKEKNLLLEPKAILKGEGSNRAYRLSQKLARQMISKDRYGFIQKQNKTGMRAVRSLSGVHFKALDNTLDDSRPGLEYMAYAFAKALTSEFLITPSTLLRLEGVSLLDPTENFPTALTLAKGQGKSLDEALAQLHLGEGGWQQYVKPKDHSFFLQATQTIGDENLDEVLEKDPTFHGDPVNLSWQLIFSLLTCPGDAKADNYGVEIQGDKKLVIGIDNDKLFYPLLYKDKDSLETGIKCVLYALQSLMENPLADEVIQAFRALNPTKVVLQWLGYLHDQNQRYEYLVNQGIFLPKGLSDLGLPLQLAPGLAEQIRTRIISLQTKLRDYPASLGNHLLHSMNPTVSEYYQALRRRYSNDPRATMWVIYKGRDEEGILQPIENVLNLPSSHEAWTQASRERVPEMNCDLISCVKSFYHSLSSSHLEKGIADTLALTLHHFKEYEDELLLTLPLNAWHLVSQEETQIPEPVFLFLLKRDPQGLNSFDIDTRTPLDYAFDNLIQTGKSEVACSFIEAGAWQASFSADLYRKLKKSLPDSFWKSFKKLEKRNAKIGWTVTLEELFPLTPHSSNHTLHIEGASGERRLLTKEAFRQLSDPAHHIAQEPREVFYVESEGHKAFIKFYPALVGLEESIGELTRRVIGFGAPHGELFRFPDGRPAWISHAIPGQTLQSVLTNNPQQLSQLDPVSTTKMILMAMLINPEDGKPANYIVEPLPDNPRLYRLVSPDNDQGLVPAFIKSKPQAASLFRNQEIVVQVKTILYCLDLMKQPIPEETRQTFLSHDPLALMKDWIGNMHAHSKRYESLYPNSQESWKIFQEKQCFLGIPFQAGMISHLYSKWERLQDYLAQENLRLTPFELLNKLEPRLANRYREVFQQKDTTWEGFVWVDGPFYQKKEGSWSTLTPSGSILTSQSIPLQEPIMGAICQGKSLGPIQALQELTTLIKQKGRSGLSLEHMASDYAREQFLKDFDFASHPLSKQRQLLNQLMPHGAGLHHLSLKNCLALTDSILQKSFLLGQIVHLDLRGCTKITHGFLSLLAKINPGLEELNLSGVIQLRWVAEATLFDYLPIVFNQLTYLNLNDCSILEAIDIEAPHLKYLWVNGTRKLSHLKTRAPNLQAISWHEALIDDQALYELLPQVPNLSHLDLTNSPNISNIGRKVGTAFCNNSKSTTLDLGGNEFHAKEAKTLTLALQHNPTLTTLNLNNNKIDDEEAKVLALVLKYNTTLTTLIVSENHIGDEGAQALALWLQHDTTLRRLDLSNNYIDYEGAQALATALKQNTTLTTLSLRWNQIDQFIRGGAEAFGSALQYNTTLTKLDLSQNYIGTVGTEALAPALKSNKTLTKLNLSGNQVNTEGACALAQALPYNETLTSLNLSKNQIDEAGALAFVQALEHNTTLIILNLKDNQIDRDVVAYMYKRAYQVIDHGNKTGSKSSVLDRLVLSTY